ncbi:hypothetical protein [Sphingopyxis sp. YF1]|uniref:hypothetical protein n=1 Tax=Sphingopyxis sp. YF1 TaxID=2482763 RepID=UPI001F6135F8|nr:hypothetical protein [Sphingopyxis sp. YF1]
MSEPNFDNPLGYFSFSVTFGGFKLGMELYDFARCFELRDLSNDNELVAEGYNSETLPAEFPPEAVEAVRRFEEWISNSAGEKS